MSETNGKGVPFVGDRAMLSGWTLGHNPFAKGSPEAVQWAADWEGENAACFTSHCESRPVKSWKTRAQEAEAKLQAAEIEIADTLKELKATGHDREGMPLYILVDRAIDKERTRIEHIRTAVAALEAQAQKVYALPKPATVNGDTITFRAEES